MPITHPVPSKSALRTLRQLALGTSCTIAFSAGLLTEDRRRRIHTVTEVRDNAQRIKSSRTYHSAGTIPLENLEEQTGRFGNDAFWLPSNIDRIPASLRSSSLNSEQTSKEFSGTFPISQDLPSPIQRKEVKHGQTTGQTTWQPLSPAKIKDQLRPTPSQQIKFQAADYPKDHIYDLQRTLARDVAKLLQSEGQIPDIDAAATRFKDAFDEGLPIGDEGIIESLTETALRLTLMARRRSKRHIVEMVFGILASHGPIDEETFYLFGPSKMIEELLQQAGPASSEINLRKACSIYLTEFKEKPKITSRTMKSLGGKLCAAANSLKLYDLTMELYSHSERSGRHCPSTVTHMITAAHAQGNYTHIFRYFKQFCVQTDPKKFQVYQVGNLVLDSMIKLEQLGKAERFLQEITTIAKSVGAPARTTWFLRVIGHDWRQHRDIARTQAMFERLRPLIQSTNHPKAIYGTLIRYCIESNQEDQANMYFAMLRESNTPDPMDVRIYGYFAYAKALRSDWSGVHEDLLRMNKIRGIEHQEHYSAAFAPIVKRYALEHSMDETEKFIHHYVDEHNLQITTSLFNNMVESYCKSKDVEALSRWINFAILEGCKINAATVNRVFQHCIDTWKCSFGKALTLYSHIRKMKGGLNFTDNETTSILRRAAIQRCPPVKVVRMRLDLINYLTKSKPGPDSASAYHFMVKALANGQHAKALQIYMHARDTGLKLGSQHLSRAVEAAIDLDSEDLSVTIGLIQDAQNDGVDTSFAAASMMISQMSHLRNEKKGQAEIKRIIHETFSTLRKQQIDISPYVVTHAMSTLERTGRFLEAVTLWDAMANQSDIHSKHIASPDIATLTVLLKAYVGLHYAQGIRWIVKTILLNELVPDKRFCSVFSQVSKGTQNTVKNLPCSPQFHDFYNTLEEARQQVQKLREKSVSEKEDVEQIVVKIVGKAIKEQAVIEKHKACYNKNNES